MDMERLGFGFEDALMDFATGRDHGIFDETGAHVDGRWERNGFCFRIEGNEADLKAAIWHLLNRRIRSDRGID
jgi:hypothetical protein